MKTTWELNCHMNVVVERRHYFLVNFVDVVNYFLVNFVEVVSYFLVNFVEVVDYFDAQGVDVLEFMMQKQHSSKHTDRRTQS